MPELFDDYEINLAAYFEHCYIFLADARSNGIDVSRYLSIFDATLLEAKSDVQKNTRRLIADHDLKSLFSQRSRLHRFLSNIQQALFTKNNKLPGTVQNKSINIKNISDSARFLAQYVTEHRHS